MTGKETQSVNRIISTRAGYSTLPKVLTNQMISDAVNTNFESKELWDGVLDEQWVQLARIIVMLS